MNAIANATAHAKGSATSRRNRNEFSKFRLLSERVESLDVDRSDRRFDAPVARFREEFWLARLRMGSIRTPSGSMRSLTVISSHP